mgnify:CR=1 FL=1
MLRVSDQIAIGVQNGNLRDGHSARPGVQRSSHLYAALERLILKPLLILELKAARVRLGQQEWIGLDLFHLFPFALVPALNEVASQIASTLAKHHERLVAPRHSRHFVSIELIARKVAHILEVALVRVGIVFADPVVAVIGRHGRYLRVNRFVLNFALIFDAVVH